LSPPKTPSSLSVPRLDRVWRALLISFPANRLFWLLSPGRRSNGRAKKTWPVSSSGWFPSVQWFTGAGSISNAETIGKGSEVTSAWFLSTDKHGVEFYAVASKRTGSVNSETEQNACEDNRKMVAEK